MSIFNVDFTKLSKLMLPIKLRSLSIVAFAKTFVAQIAWLYEVFKIKREEHLYRVNHNGQICKLEAVLNDRFDETLRRIFIEDGDVVLPKWFYRRIEAKPKYFRKRSESAPVFMRRRSEMSFGGTFTIVMPSGLIFDINELKALANSYKLAGKRYTVKIV